MKQTALTCLAPVMDEKLEVLRSVFANRKDDLEKGLRNIGTIHYARWVIVDKVTIDNETFPTQLAFSSNFDGDADEHIQALDKLGPLLDALYVNCVNYSPQNRIGFFKETRVKEAAFYQGAPGRSVKTVEQEKNLRNYILEIINKGTWQGRPAKDIHRAIQQQVFSNPEFAWAKEPIKVPQINWFGVALVFIVLFVLSPLILLWAAYIQFFYERKDKPQLFTPNQLSDDHMARMQADEDFVFQNQFSQIITMKPGKARLFTLSTLYMVARILTKVLFVNGKLMGIPTIHFARWVMVNKKKQMLFYSNFDGSWTQYLGDFIDKSSIGLTGIFGNTLNFPPSLFLILKGATDEEHFLAWSRNTQIKTLLWYAADTSQSIKNVNNNTMIRNELSRQLSEKQAKIFLSRI
jgi:hypothetical protein